MSCFQWLPDSVELLRASKTLSYVEKVFLLSLNRYIYFVIRFILWYQRYRTCFRWKGLHSRNTICQFFYDPFTEKVQVILSIWIIYPASTVALTTWEKQNSPVCLNEITCRFNRHLYSNTKNFRKKTRTLSWTNDSTKESRWFGVAILLRAGKGAVSVDCEMPSFRLRICPRLLPFLTGKVFGM